MTVDLQLDGPIARLALDRPDKLNAMGPAFWDEFGEVVGRIDADPQARVADGLGERRDQLP